MKEIKKASTLVVLPALFAALFFVAACGNSNKKSTSPATAPGQASAVVVGMSACTTCHTVVTADWIQSKHANAAGGDLNSPGNPTLAQDTGSCVTCHDPLGDSQRLTAGLTGNNPRPVVGCESCHGGGSLHAQAGGTGVISRTSNATGATYGAITVSGQFVMCTSCHGLLNTSGTGTVVATHDPSSGVTPIGAQYVITDTHFATPGNFSGSNAANVNNITGYAMDYSSERVCIDCHNPHKTADIDKEWALSKHADMRAAGAWAHYNWSCDTSCYGPSGDRRICQRCHTATGLAAYADALQSGDAALAASIRTGNAPPLSANKTFKPEMLKCNGCHTDYRGALRNPGAYTADYSYVSGNITYASSSYAYPDASSSNVCILCHSARQNGGSVRNLVLSGPTITTFANISFIDSHYLSAAGTMYTATGYRFGGRSYANPASYKHNLIGSQAAPNTGTGGPCVGCHMYRAGASANHLFRAAGMDSAGTVTNIVSEVCYNCHAGSSSSLAAIAQQENSKFDDALAALVNQADLKGVSFNNVFPYMFKQRYKSGTVAATNGSPTIIGKGTLWSSASVTTASDAVRIGVDGTIYSIASVDSDTQITLTTNYAGPLTANSSYVIMKTTRADGVKNWLFGGSEEGGRNNMGAIFNLQLLEHEPGAYVHNSKYVKRLIYDALDWLDDGILNYSVGATLNMLPPETAYKNGAMLYLLPNGVITGVDAERP